MIDDLLDPRRIEPLEPRAEDADAAWREVSRRRRVRTLRSQVAAGVAVVAMVMIGVLPSLDDGGRVADLKVADRDGAPGNHLVPMPEGRADQSTPTGQDHPLADAVESRSPTAEPGKSIEPPATPTARPRDEAPTAGRAKPTVERTRYASVPIGCIDWCLSGDVVAQGDGFLLSLDLCLPVGGRARRFSFSTTQEVDFRIDTAGTPGTTVWTWSLGQHFPARDHHVDIQSGECVRWSAPWDATDEAGRRVPGGSYRLRAASLAEQLQGTQAADRSFQVPE